MNLLKNIKISIKVYGGFAIVIAFLLLISFTGWREISKANDIFTRYRSIALQSNQAGRVQANLLEARLAVKNFIINGSPENIETVNTRIGKTLALKDEFAKIADSGAMKETIKHSGESLEQYSTSFQEVTGLQALRNELVIGTLDVVGPQIEKKLTAIMKSADEDDDAHAAFLAGMVQRNLLLMRLYATKFLVTNDEATFDRVLKESAEMRRHHNEMLAELQNPTRRKLAEEVADLQTTYDKAFAQVNQTINARNDIILGTLDQIGPQVASDMEALKLAIKAEQDTVGPKASADMKAAITTTFVVSLVSVVIGLLAAWLIGNGISRPIQRITSSMKALSEGDKNIEIPGQDHRDEVGDMAAAVQIFKENMIKNDELAERELQAAEGREKRGRLIEKLTQDFDAGVSELLGALGESATEMKTTAGSMTSIADQTNERSTAVAAAAQQASANVQTVATAAEELSSSISEIGRQVAHSSDTSKRAVDQVNTTNDQVKGLAKTAQQIGDVINLISDIAEQTNLLALNATIEAARAGEAGKGFAVVASEVKNLATQTAKATEEISQQIGGVQSETDAAATAMEAIGATINELNEVATAIAEAVDEQGAATAEIARNVEEASAGTQDVTVNITEVTRAAGETGSAAAQVTGVVGELNAQADQLRDQVQKFLSAVKAA
ncbi:methyl-accepting chemotaxis protein [Nisaea sp.]|uniref:HAMP domain-containing methyl-accepting chemotaxis protein n=1 Tax=Nisaea sp. TaxID=2024842 RepID=UPI003297523E